MQDWNKKNLILFGIMAACGLTVFFTFVLLWYVNKSGGLWCAPLPVAAIGYAIYTIYKKYFPLTK